MRVARVLLASPDRIAARIERGCVAPEQVDLERPKADVGAVAILPRIILADEGGAGVTGHGRQLACTLDTILCAGCLNIRERCAQVAIIGERAFDHSLEFDVVDQLRPGQARRSSLCRGIGFACGQGRRHRRGGPDIGRSHVAARQCQRTGQQEEGAGHAGNPASGAGLCGGALVLSRSNSRAMVTKKSGT